MHGRIAASGHLGDLDIAFCKEPGKVMYDARLIETHHIDRIGQQLLAEISGSGTLDLNAEVLVVGEACEILLQSADGMPVAGNEQ